MRTWFMLSPPAVYAPLSQTGVSDEAFRLRQSWENVFATIVNSVTMGSQYHSLQASLANLSQETASDNWDGHGASAVNPEALGYAKRIVRMLPNTYPAPEVSIDPDGEISFDWQVGPKSSLSFSVSPVGTLRYASIVGSSENFGSEPWREGIPETVARLLQKIASYEATN